MSCRFVSALSFASFAAFARVSAEEPFQPFLEQHCTECHDADTKKGNLDLTALKLDLTNAKTFNTWVTVFDRVSAGEMPPKKQKSRPDPASQKDFTQTLSTHLTEAEQRRIALEGRATQRRLNRYEYENAMRDLLHAPWLQLKDSLPEDGESHRFNKIGEALDVSHVQMARYLSTAESALRQVLATQVQPLKTTTTRYYARDQSSFINKMKFTVFNMSAERATFPLLGYKAQPDVRAGAAPPTVGKKDPVAREQEAIGFVASSYEPLETKFNLFKTPVSGRYKIRISAYSVWVGPGKMPKWWKPDLDNVSIGRRPEPITVYAEMPPRLLRRIGTFDAAPEPGVQEFDTLLLAGEFIRPDAARLFRSRPPNYQNPLAEKDGAPGVAYRWLEVEGPLYDKGFKEGRTLLFGDLPLTKTKAGVDATSTSPAQDAERLLTNFMEHAYRRPVSADEPQRFLAVINGAMGSGSTFTDAMIAGYTAVLCSPEFLCLEERPGTLNDHAIAARLSFFLWNSSPDDELRTLASRGELHKPEVLRAQTRRLIADPKSRRFVDAFLAYWLDLRKMVATSPDSGLYPDYYLDDLLTESAQDETQLFFAELLKNDLPARNVVSSDFAMLNERLAKHYDLPPVEGSVVHRVALPADSTRGGLMTQASILKVTANGTTTSPVLRGAWIMERILGKPVPPPPPNVPAVEPDTRGATTIRQQLDKHRNQEVCASCHSKIDPAGFALENFDVMGGWREFYRALSDGAPTEGIGHNGQKFTFHSGQPVDSSGTLPDGRKFKDIRELKQLLLRDERQVARNITQQLTVYATGAPIRFADRAPIEKILDGAKPTQYGVRSLIEELVQSDLFLKK